MTTATIEAPVKETTEIVIEPNPVQEALYLMLDQVRAGRWIRNSVGTSGADSHRCIYGMAMYVTGEHYF